MNHDTFGHINVLGTTETHVQFVADGYVVSERRSEFNEHTSDQTMHMSAESIGLGGTTL